ncbi:MAG TPA: branched-chain amino acid ABC transporter permease [Burkholderiaceae bacterium]|nr:branched-chain amino acid ABC transporter permease [Burkholderiaceae bacterium]
MEQSITLILNCLTLISILILVSLGLAIIFGLMNVINLAHGDFVTVGAYTLAFTQAMGGNYWLALFLAPFVGAALGWTIERSMMRHLYHRPQAIILATWGLGMIIQQLLQLGFGAAPQRVSGPFDGAMEIFGATYPVYRLALIVFCLLVVAIVYTLLRWSRFGLDVRAIIQDHDMASALGIDTARVNSAAFALGAALAAVAGVLIAPLTVVVAQMGINYLARSFFVVIVGGAGSATGVVAGSSIVGGLETLMSYQLPPTVAQALVLVVAIVLVRFRPRGLVAS